MNLRQILTAPNQLTLLRMIFLPFIVINLVKHDFKWALALFILVLSIERMIPWKYTVVVFSRDVSILLISGVLFMIAGLRDFRPSIFGKANTFAQVAAIFFVLLLPIEPVRWIWIAQITFLRATFIFTIVSAVHYALLVQHRLHASASTPAAIQS